jgi:hypothetical protein
MRFGISSLLSLNLSKLQMANEKCQMTELKYTQVAAESFTRSAIWSLWLAVLTPQYSGST